MPAETSQSTGLASNTSLFPCELIEDEVAKLRAISPEVFRREELAILSDQNPPLQVLHGERLAIAIRNKGPEVADRRSRGLLVASHILRRATEEQGQRLPVRSTDEIANYTHLVTVVAPAKLETDFERDYSAHLAVLALVHDSLHPESRSSAKLVFNLFGELANPERPLESIPRRPAQQSPGSSHSEQRRMRAYAGQRRFSN